LQAYVYLPFLENLSGRGTAAQSTTAGAQWSADRAIDDGKDISVLSASCAATNVEARPWWRLDLQAAYRVSIVVVTYREDCCPNNRKDFQIRFGNSLQDEGNANPSCAVVSTIPAGATYSYSCHGMEGRYVTVNIPGTSKILTLCEVGVDVIFPGNSELLNNLAIFTFFISLSNYHFIKLWSSCSSTDIQTNPWWRVDLSSVYRVSRVVITNKLDCCPERINGTKIRTGNSLENNGNNNPICAVISSIPAGVSFTYICNMEGRYVNLFIPGYLTLCEVEVYGEGVIKQGKSSYKLMKFLILGC
uniref:Fucolectin tachylectin-4 pentraxin-1 domain-containing protein n=1 Tax=Sinocyclocheilus grahami TaxID=75366 RepID=A0A672PJX5_SINGR